MPTRITSDKIGDKAYICLNDILHVVLFPSAIVGLQSYIDYTPDIVDNYKIEIYCTHNHTIILEYNSKEKWEEVLREIHALIQDE